MSALRTRPTWSEIAVTILTALVIHHYCRHWVFVVFLTATTLWISTFVYAAVRIRVRNRKTTP